MSVQVIRFAPGLKPVLKHGTHDQKTHGSWATLTNTTFGDYKMTFEYQPSNELPLHFIHAYDQNKKQVGQLRWDSYTGTVNSISVEPEHQRKGIATAMWNWATKLSKTPAKDFPENIKHGWGIQNPRHDRFIVTPQGKSWVESLQKHEGGGHDQSSHGNWAHGQKGGSGLSHREMFELKKQPDPLASKVYAAEEKNHNQIQDKNADSPFAPNRTQFTNFVDYDKAYKQYLKDFTAWSKKVTTSLISPMGQKHLDGTPRGVNGYVRDVLRQDWFVEAFGKGGVAGNNLEVKVSTANEAGAYQIGFKNEVPVSNLRISRGYTKAEPTIVHEIAHYATTISATSPHGGHGVEFARNHIFITSKLFGASFADGLEKSYREAGVPLGD